MSLHFSLKFSSKYFVGVAQFSFFAQPITTECSKRAPFSKIMGFWFKIVVFFTVHGHSNRYLVVLCISAVREGFRSVAASMMTV